MKILFIGEGRHDIGDPNPNTDQPRPAQGTIPTLCRKICSLISSESVALAWKEIRRFNPFAQKRGYRAKVAAAALLAVKKFACAGTTVVADRDGEVSRESALQDGVSNAQQLFPRFPIVWGLAVESVEAWTLGVPSHIAEELGIDLQTVHEQYPRGVSVESLSERSGKEEYHPKRLLQRITQLKSEIDSTAFRQAIAERTDVKALEKACPQGFAPFAAQVRAVFGE